MVCDPKSSRVISIRQQIDPENNNDVEKAFEEVVDMYPNTDTLVYDKNCSFAPSKMKNKKFKKVKNWPVAQMSHSQR